MERNGVWEWRVTSFEPLSPPYAVIWNISNETVFMTQFCNAILTPIESYICIEFWNFQT